MEDYIVKIAKFNIKKLFGYADYSIKFNKDITFLYGDNGCGKTTMLNIITSIITGKVYELFRYDFENLSLKYYDTQKNLSKTIKIEAKEPKSLVVSYDDETVQIDAQRYEVYRRNDDIDELEHYYFSEYDILSKIKNVFNYIYLPLNRSGSSSFDFVYSNRMRKLNSSRHSWRGLESGSNFTLYNVEQLISNAYSQVNYSLNRASEQFSDYILKSFLDVENSINIQLIIDYLNKLTNKEIHSIQKDYMSIIKNIGKWDDDLESKINEFFDSLERKFDEYRIDGENRIDTELLFKLSELTKIEKIINNAEDFEAKKKSIKQPIDDFLNTVNSFIGNENANKTIKISTDGNVYLETPTNSEIPIYYLSSGEKQIITFFAYLVFALPKTNQSIFIVDEPELSLHLNWQRKFVDLIMSINENIQLIFATHAPEMVGRYRNKAVKLIVNNNGINK
ncbi:MAG: ATP-binding protein [Clostridia bacterium]|nr:ATP-binding protein [Clostridia bacterium]